MIPKEMLKVMILYPSSECGYLTRYGNCYGCFMEIHCIELYMESNSHMNDYSFNDIYKMYRYPAACRHYTDVYGEDALFKLLL